MRGTTLACSLTVALVAVAILCGCGSSFGPPGPPGSGPLDSALVVGPYPGPDQYYRYRDVLNNEYVNPTSGNDYNNGLYDGWYDPPNLVSYNLSDGDTLAGTIAATGLKPNFAYQVKLEGMPTKTYAACVSAPPTDVENWSNIRIGSAGRWWCDTCGKNVSDGQLPAHRRHRVLGYLLFDFFVTDGAGTATRDLHLDSSFHVLWREDQRTPQANDGPPREQTVTYSPDDYKTPFDTATASVYAEWEPNRPLPGQVTLPAGNYQCRLLLTEESFHNSPPEVGWPYALTQYADGGFWAHALSDNAFAFTIGAAPPPPSGVMHVADIAMDLQTKGPMTNATATVSVGDGSTPAAPVSGVMVSGTWSGVVSGSVSGTTDSSGQVTLASPKTRSHGTFTFTVDGLAKSGWTYTAPSPPPSGSIPG